jgi:hypothetical protein
MAFRLDRCALLSPSIDCECWTISDYVVDPGGQCVSIQCVTETAVWPYDPDHHSVRGGMAITLLH